MPFEIDDSKRELWVPVIQKLVLSLSDQQLLTGFAVLIAGFWTHCSISVYHFALVSDLAWFSANVHLVTLSVLGTYLSQRPVVRNLRVVLMITLALLLTACTVMQGHYKWYDSWPYDAQCLFDDLVGNIASTPRYWMIVDLVLICIDYPLHIITLFEKPTEFFEHWLQTKPVAAKDQAIRHLAKAHRRSDKSFKGSIRCFTYTLLIVIVRGVSWTYFALTALIDSKICDLILNTFWFAYGLKGIIGDRKIPTSDMIGDENAMTFGQIIPILLLSSFVLIFLEAYSGTWSNSIVGCR